LTISVVFFFYVRYHANRSEVYEERKASRNLIAALIIIILLFDTMNYVFEKQKAEEYQRGQAEIQAKYDAIEPTESEVKYPCGGFSYPIWHIGQDEEKWFLTNLIIQKGTCAAEYSNFDELWTTPDQGPGWPASEMDGYTINWDDYYSEWEYEEIVEEVAPQVVSEEFYVCGKAEYPRWQAVGESTQYLTSIYVEGNACWAMYTDGDDLYYFTEYIPEYDWYQLDGYIAKWDDEIGDWDYEMVDDQPLISDQIYACGQAQYPLWMEINGRTQYLTRVTVDGGVCTVVYSDYYVIYYTPDSLPDYDWARLEGSTAWWDGNNDTWKYESE